MQYSVVEFLGIYDLKTDLYPLDYRLDGIIIIFVNSSFTLSSSCSSVQSSPTQDRQDSSPIKPALHYSLLACSKGPLLRISQHQSILIIQYRFFSDTDIRIPTTEFIPITIPLIGNSCRDLSRTF